MARWRRRFGLGLLALVLLFWLPPLPAELQTLQPPDPVRFLDRNGELLRATAPEGLRQAVGLGEISPSLIQATLTAEDERFYWHCGVDPIAVGRALLRNWKAGRVVQGASTLSQQLVRMRLRSDQRNLTTKLAENYWAVRLELTRGKRALLEAYLDQAPYGMQTYGCEAAAQLYFGVPAAQLSLAQSAFLAVLPRAPETFLPYQDLEDVQKYQRGLILRMQSLGHVTAEEANRALREPIHLKPLDEAWEAGHFCDFVMQRAPHLQGDVHTTLDLRLQREVEGILSVHLKRLARKGVRDGAVVVLDVENGDILAMAGSGSYALNQFNASTAGRQPGSTLKPFLYEVALERGWTPATLLPDLDLYPQQTERGYIPANYDNRYHGPVRLREALACSYNVPPVRVLERLGVDTLLNRLRRLGFTRLDQPAKHYGLGLTLGVGEVTLLDLARAYRCLARRGLYSAERALAEEQPATTREMDPVACAVIADILQDAQARAPAFGLSGPLNLPFPCAVKTGTSKGYRDNWTVGFTPLYVVAVWVGNFDGSSMRGAVSGVTGAGPVFHDVMEELVRRDGGSPEFSMPEGVVARQVCETSGELPGPVCTHTRTELFDSRHLPPGPCSLHREVTFDRRTGTVARGEVPEPYLERRIYCVYPPLYRAWALAQGIPQPPPGFDSGQPQADVAIAFPDDRAVFRLERDLPLRYQKLHARVLVPDWCERVEWQIGDEKCVVQTRPFDLWWTLRRGGVVLRATALGPRGRRQGSRAIRILVQ